MLHSTSKWRPCCGSCRSERLVEVDTHGEHFLRCEDCGARWDGAELTPGEARDRHPPRKAPPLALTAEA